ncbi:MAG: type 4a pilus biogenesis protein PilO [Candidatus Omnitrophica bacterium]|nr:type 4a pilus biogenesis protein PilO [Candidatus Omnitrophota bacterium]
MKMIGLKFLAGLSKRERLFFGLTIGLVLCLAVYIFIVEPFYKKSSQLDTSISSASARLFKNLRLLSDKDAIEKEYDKYKDYVQAGAGEEQMAALLKEIEDTASNCGVKITSIKPKGSKEMKSYRKFTIELNAEGKIDQFLKFIYEIEGSKRLFKVERFILSLKGGQSDLLKGTLSIRKIAFQ